MSLPEKFWANLNTGENHDVLDAGRYHIQHVVKNQKLYGLSNEDIDKHAESHPDHLESGVVDTDYGLEHHVMTKGFARGYHYNASKQYSGTIALDVATPEHGKMAVKHFLPMVQEAEAKGLTYDMHMDVGDRGKPRSQSVHHTFTSSKQMEEHIGKFAPSGLKSKTPETFSQFGKVSTQMRGDIKKMIRSQDPSMPRWKQEQETGAATGSWGDSMEYKTFKQLFTEILEQTKPSAGQQMRQAGRPSTTRRLAQAGGDAVIAGGVAKKAGLTPSQLAALEKRAGAGKRVTPAVAQRIAAAVLKQK